MVVVLSGNSGFSVVPIIDLNGIYALGDELSVIAWRMVDDGQILAAVPITIMGEPDTDYLVVDALGNVGHPREGSVYSSTSIAIDTLNRGE